MSTEVRWRRGTAAQHTTFTGAMSEITHDTTNNNIRVHDGFTEGGHATLMEREKGVAGGLATLDDTGNVPVEQLGNASQPHDFPTRADLQGSSVRDDILFVRTAGYYAVGDGGGALYKRSVSEPAHAGKVQSADGAWWELAEAAPLITMFGAIADGVTNVSSKIQDALDYVKIVGGEHGGSMGIPNNGRQYVTTQQLDMPTGCRIELYGIGYPEVKFNPTAAGVNADFMHLGATVHSMSLTVIRDIFITGNNTNGRNCFYGELLSNLKLYNVFMYNFKGYCVDLVDCWCFSMEGGQCIGNAAETSLGGIRVTRGTGNQGQIKHVRMNDFKHANAAALFILGDDTNTHHGFLIENNAFEFNKCAIYCTTGKALTFDTNYFEFNETNIQAIGTGGTIEGLSFINNVVFEGGVNLINCRGLKVDGNSFRWNAAFYIEDVSGSYSIGINTFENVQPIFSTGTPRKNYEAQGAWISYAATWQSIAPNPVLNNGTLVSKFKRSGNTVDVAIMLTMGAATTYGDYHYRFTLPFAAAAGAAFVGRAGYNDVSADKTVFDMTPIIEPNGLVVFLRNNSGNGLVGKDSPITWAAGDKIFLNITYECVTE
ncbi:hypothetical protein [Ochrobactrum sp. S1502_03]|uniref:hyaluronate lyase N-terminal domain-containing protein n=1 Tax=Ochrobactrum sp. S1502_03 TaxID=3108451 RepID=UPI0037C9D8FC